MCADGDPADAQTEQGGEMGKDTPAGAREQYRGQTTVSPSAVSSIVRGSARPWSAGLPGVSNRPGSRVETTPDGRLGPSSDHHSGRVLAVHQDVRLATGVHLQYRWTFLVPQLRRAVDLRRYWTIWCRWKGSRGRDALIAVGFHRPGIKCTIRRRH